MVKSEVNIRVRYAETDQMGYVYYGNYATYFEVARVETFRHLGFSYKAMEEEGILMPVLELKTKYIKAAKYDDLLTIKTTIADKPGVRIRFEYEVFNEQEDLLTKAETTLVFINAISGRPSIPTPNFQSILDKSFE